MCLYLCEIVLKYMIWLIFDPIYTIHIKIIKIGLPLEMTSNTEPEARKIGFRSEIGLAVMMLPATT